MTWYHNFYESLTALGHDVYLFSVNLDKHFLHASIPQWLKQHREKLTDQMWLEFSEQQKRNRFDLFFGYLCNGFIEYSLLEDIGNLGVPTLNFSCNNIHQFYLVDEISKHVDIAVYSEKTAKQKFDSVGANGVHMQMAANPDIYHPYSIPKEYEVTFAGQRYANRAEYIVDLISNGVDVRAWGPKWTGAGNFNDRRDLAHKLLRLRSIFQVHGVRKGVRYISGYARERVTEARIDRMLAGHVGMGLDDEALVKLYSQSKISLGFSTVYEGGLPGGAVSSHVRLRDFEAPMSGAFYLVEHTPEIEEYYEVGKEIECYRSKDELLDKTKYYLRADKAREKIRLAGHRRALRDHTWKIRFSDLFAQLSSGIHHNPL